MHLLHRRRDGGLSRTAFYNNIPPYAILSHRWVEDEPTFHDITTGTGKDKAGYAKLQFCGRQAAKDNLKYFWVDTVCIDKTSSAELTEALNSMFRWYREATKCYVYLRDVVRSDSDLQRSEWFTRGWTLQELLAPKTVEFFSSDGNKLGDKISLERKVHSITGIPVEALRGHPLSNFSIAERMSWIAKRVTTREEDQAYCLLGIFDVFMPIIYGEGKRAFRRLGEEVEKSSQASGNFLQNVPSSQRKAQNNGYNCFRPIHWGRAAVFSRAKLGKCGTCGFRWCDDQVPDPPTLADGRKIPSEVMWQRFHYQPAGEYYHWKGELSPLDGTFRCFICRDGEELNWSDIKDHLARKHTYSQICD